MKGTSQLICFHGYQRFVKVFLSIMQNFFLFKSPIHLERVHPAWLFNSILWGPSQHQQLQLLETWVHQPSHRCVSQTILASSQAAAYTDQQEDQDRWLLHWQAHLHLPAGHGQEIPQSTQEQMHLLSYLSCGTWPYKRSESGIDLLLCRLRMKNYWFYSWKL